MMSHVDKMLTAYKALCSKLYRRYTEQKQLEPYCGIVIAWLEKKLKKI